jgi:PAS domain S-box-containing protein
VPFQECLDFILEAAIELTQAERGNIQILQCESGSLTIAAQRGFSEEFLKFFANVSHDDAAACGAAMQSGQRIVVADVTQSEIFGGQPALDVLLRAGVRAVQSTPLLSSTGSIVGMISTHFGAPHRPGEHELLLLDLLSRQAADFIERKRREEQFIENERTFFQLVERAPFGIYIVDSQFRIVQMNAGSQAGAFRNVKPVVGRDFGEAMRILWPDPVASEVIEVFRRTLETGEPYYSRDFRRQRHDVDTVESYEWELHRLKLPDGRYAVICYYFDSTRLREVEQALRRSERQLEVVSDNVPALIFYLDLERRYRTCNDAFTVWFGVPRDQIIGTSLQEFVGEAAWTIIGPRIERAFGAETVDLEAEIPYRLGGSRWIHAVYTPHRDLDGTVLGVVGLVTDITRDKRLLEQEQAARKQAESANRLKDEFLATVSHELRTPLTSILGWAHMLRGGRVPPDKLQAALEVIERNARAQNHLIDDLLDVSRIISGKVRLDVRAIDPVVPIDAAIDSIFPAAEAKRVEVQKIVGDCIGLISCDVDRLQQIVWNLVSNAIKFTPPGGTIQIRLERSNSHFHIVVSDTGIGINAEFLPYVFDRFRQGDAAVTRAFGGLGLGLAIARHLVELHGGEISAHSLGEGKGAAFTVKLPASTTKESDSSQQTLQPQISGYLSEDEIAERLDGLLVLAVDDDPDARELLRNMIEHSGAQVTTATSADDALALLLRTQFDLIVSDIGMPEKDGYQFMQQVRRLPSGCGGKTPAIALTAFARAEDRLHALRSGYQAHVPKPIEYVELITVVGSLAARPRQ